MIFSEFKNIFIVFSVLFLVSFKLSYASPTYQGREQEAHWRKEATERIERIRKSNLLIHVVDGKGKPVSGAVVEVAMQRHAFAFGSAVTAHNLMSEDADGQKYRQLVERNFNKVTLENDLKWGPWESSKDNMNPIYRIYNTEKALNWLKERDIPVRGHYAVWGHMEGDGGTTQRKELPANLFREAVLKHAEEKVRRIGQRVVEWDVLNHPIGWGKGNMSEAFGKEFYDGVFRDFSGWNPNAMRVINEGGVLPHNGYNREKYYQLLAEMLSRGAKVESIGFMGHFKAGRDLASPEELLSTFDLFAKFGLPLQVTEFDVRFGNEMNKPLALTSEQEALQADYTRDFLVAAFSHPGVSGVIMWGFWEGRHWYPDAALYRRDWRTKPNGKIWEELVLQKWWTNVSGITNTKGAFSARGFLGDYILKVSKVGKKQVVKSIKLDTSGEKIQIVLQ